MQRNEALELMEENIKQKNLRKHCLAVEAVMAELANYFDKDEHKWRLAGLLHDIDYEDTADQPEKHSQIGADMLSKMGMEAKIVDAVRAHLKKGRHRKDHQVPVHPSFICSRSINWFNSCFSFNSS